MKSKALVLTILLLTFFLRAYNFPQWYGFDYDQEINAQIAKTVLVDHKPVLIGPETSVGGMYVGPYYNYVISAFYLFGRMDPRWNLLLNLLVSGLTVWLLYFAGKKLFSEKAGLLAALIYACSSLMINYDRSAWNPMPVPLVSIGIVTFLVLFSRERRTLWLFLATVFAGFSLHLHPNALFLVAFYALFILLLVPRAVILNLKRLLLIIGVFLFFLLPLIIFDFRHQFINSTHFITFFFGGSKVGGISFVSSLINIASILTGLLAESIFANQSQLAMAFVAGVLVLTIKNIKAYAPYLLLFSLTLIGFSFYHGPLPSQYLLFLFPVFILLLASLLTKYSVKSPGKLAVLALFIIFLVLNLPKALSFKYPLALKYKLQVVNYIVANAHSSLVSVDFVTEPGLKTGYKYLFWLKGVTLTETNPSYKIIVLSKPYTKAPGTLSFGGIDVLKL